MRPLAITIMLALGLALDACGDEDPLAPPPSHIVPANPDATPPAMPEQAKEDSHAGVSRFVRHYVDLLNYAAQTGDVGDLVASTGPDCTSCRNYIDLFAETYESGGYFKGGEWLVGETEVRYSTSDEPAYVTATVRTRRGSQRLSAGEEETRTSAKRYLLTFEVTPGVDRRIAEISHGGFE